MAGKFEMPNSKFQTSSKFRTTKTLFFCLLRKGWNAQAGFTLVELIVTFTILSIVVVMILGAMRLGTASWERGEEKTERYQRRRMVFNLLSQQLKSAYAYKIKAQKAESDYLAFLGSGDSLKFVSTFSLTAKRPEGLVFVVYQVGEGDSSGKVLKVYEGRVLNKDFMEETPDGDKFLTLLEGLSEIAFEYFKEGEEQEEAGEWMDSWDAKEEKELPRQIKIVTKWKEKKEEPEDSLSTLVSLPANRFDDRGRRAARPLPTRRPVSRPR
jgi:general secretion pathway protein J